MAERQRKSAEDNASSLRANNAVKDAEEKREDAEASDRATTNTLRQLFGSDGEDDSSDEATPPFDPIV